VSSKPLELVRGLGLWSATAIVAGTMIGTGIFLVPSEMAQATGSVGLVFVAWIAGGTLTLFGAFAFAELGAAIPEAGGPYVYLKRAFGPAWGFLFGWMTAVVERPASAAAIAAGLLLFWSFLMPAVATPLFAVQIPLPFQAAPHEFQFTLAQPLAALAILFVTGINHFGVRLGGRFQVVLTVIKSLAVLAVVVLGLTLGRTDGPVDPQAGGLPGAALGGFLTALVAALWAYDGWTGVTFVGSEVANPEKNISRALVWGVLFVGGMYVLANLVYFSVLSLGGVAQSEHVASDVVEQFAGRGAAQWITIAMVISALGTLNSTILSGARVPYAMARDGLFFDFASRIHPTYRVPGHSLWFQAGLGSLFALTGTFEELFSLVIFAAWIFYGLTVAAMFQLRRKEPDLERPYRTLGYPWAPALFVIGALALTVNLWLELPVRSSIGLLLILSGLVFYRRWRKTQPAAP
jgi:APA family basic amino acid/polyamine antiporter